MNSLPKTVIRQRRGCNLNSGPSASESSTLTTWPSSHPHLGRATQTVVCVCVCALGHSLGNKVLADHPTGIDEQKQTRVQMITDSAEFIRDTIASNRSLPIAASQ